MKRISCVIFFVTTFFFGCNSSKEVVNNLPIETNNSSNCYWQQHVDYTMSIDMDVETYQYQGVQKLVYTNNSPDVLNKVYYHLYFNAFQPGSEMDVRSRTIADPDARVGDRISKLQPNEIGYINVSSLKQNGKTVSHKTVGTILEVKLNNPIQPGEKVTFDMIFDAQVPVQIRRSGRNNKEGVALSMAQWYPKLAEYDFEGWHADPYIGREFHGVWGNFDVKLTIDKDYVVGGTGYLQDDIKTEGNKKTLHYIAPNVHDFTWAADPDYIHDTLQVPDGPMLHFYYKSTMPEDKLENWRKLQPKAKELMEFFSSSIGKYPYKQYSIIQGGDGGMEYGMCTLIVGEGTFGGLFGVTAHEMVHSWFQFVLATNELSNYWMDEGFTEYYEGLAKSVVLDKPFNESAEQVYNVYYGYAKSGTEQPQTTHADRFNYNRSSVISAYYKGFVFLNQLAYVIGEENQKKTIKEYYKNWSFKHPTPNDFIRIAEKVSDLHLRWYLNDWTRTTNTIDYGVKEVTGNSITLERIGLMPMPLDVTVTYTDGSSEDFLIPLRMMRGHKPTQSKVIADWPWAFPTYTFEVSKEIQRVTIDTKGQMADIDQSNNSL